MKFQAKLRGRVAAGRRGALRLGMAVALLAGAILVGLNPAPAQATTWIGLGQAANYVLFDVSNSEWSMSNSQTSVTVYGDWAAGPGTTYTWAGGGGPYSSVADPVVVYYQTGGIVPPVDNLGGTPKPTTQATDLTQAVLDARAAAASAAGLTANMTVPGGAITNSSGTITLANPGENVVDLTTVNMSSGNVLISGTAGQTVIFRVSGNFNVGNSTLRVTGGLTPNDVLWYFPNDVTIKSPNGAWDGTILALNSGVNFDNTPTGLGPVRGAIIAADDVNNNQDWKFVTNSGFDIDFYPTPTVPLPPSALLLGSGLVALVVWRRRRA